MSGRNRRVVPAAAALVLGLVATFSYAAQRLWAAASGNEAYNVILAQEHIPYFWRCDVALLHGLLAACIAGLALTDDQAGRLLALGGWLVLLVVLPSAVAMVVVP